MGDNKTLPIPLFSTEYELQVRISNWLTIQYPKVLFRMDLGGIRLPISLAMKAKRLNPNRAWPDIFIAEPRSVFRGLFIELKRCRSELLTKDGQYRKTKHIEEQRAVLSVLRSKGYRAEFGCGFDEVKQIIDDYLDRRR